MSLTSAAHSTGVEGGASECRAHPNPALLQSILDTIGSEGASQKRLHYVVLARRSMEFAARPARRIISSLHDPYSILRQLEISHLCDQSRPISNKNSPLADHRCRDWQPVVAHAHRTCRTPAAISFCSFAEIDGSCIAACAFFGSVCISDKMDRICASPRMA